MNESRFIELLNLYVDQQLSSREASELEAEIQKNPARHRTYQQYCRMQKACAQLFEHERSAAPASLALSRALADADRKIVGFPDGKTRRSIWPVGFSIGAITAAACVAFVVVLQSDMGVGASGRETVASAKNAPVQPERAVQAVVKTEKTDRAATAVTLASSEEFTHVFTMLPLRPSSARPEGLFVSGTSTGAQIIDWTNEVQLKPLRKVSAEEFVFDRPAVGKPVSSRFAPTSNVEEPATEMNAFQFTK
jgi:hypothetical protein